MTKTKLDLWMGDTRDDLWLAALIGCSRPHASKVRRGAARPSLQKAIAIEKATRGKVKAADLLVAPVAANDSASAAEAA